MKLPTSPDGLEHRESREKTGNCHGRLKLPTDTKAVLVQPLEEEYLSQQVSADTMFSHELGCTLHQRESQRYAPCLFLQQVAHFC